MNGLRSQSEYVGLQDKLLARVNEKPGETPRELASYLEANYDSVTRALSRLNQYNRVFAVEAQYFPIYDDMDALVASAFKLERVRLRPVSNWRRWWRRLGRLAGIPWLGVPAAFYFVAMAGGYGLGRWFI